MKESHWTYKNKPFNEIPKNSFGFAYIITNLKSNKKYIGRKYFYSTRRKPLTKKQKEAGRKNRKRVTKETDWRTYTGSSKQLNNDIEKLGKENFKFEILGIGRTKGEVNYIEEAAHFKFNVLLDENYYNDTIGPRRYLGLKKKNEFHKNILEIFNET